MSFDKSILSTHLDSSVLQPRAGEYPIEQITFKTLFLDNLELTDEEKVKLQSYNDGLDLLALTADTSAPKIATGMQLSYRQTWRVEAVALGQLLYSLTLAPGEVVRIAMQDGSRTTKAHTKEDIAEQERLANENIHNRSISEVTNALAQEAQSGFSSSSTSSKSLSMANKSGINLVVFNTGNTRSKSTNSSDTSSSSFSNGNRSLSASMNQQIRDKTQQFASAARNKYSKVIHEVSERETETAGTRIVANYNHMHTLTMQYYEMLQIFQTKLQLIEVEKCLFIPIKLIDFTNQDVLKDKNIQDFLTEHAIIQDIQFEEINIQTISDMQYTDPKFPNAKLRGNSYDTEVAAFKNYINSEKLIKYKNNSLAPQYNFSAKAVINKIVFFGEFFGRDDYFRNIDDGHNQKIKHGSPSEMGFRSDSPFKIYLITKHGRKILLDKNYNHEPLFIADLNEILFENKSGDDVKTPSMLLDMNIGQLFIPCSPIKHNDSVKIEIKKVKVDMKQTELQHLTIYKEYYNYLFYKSLPSAKLCAILSSFTYHKKPLLTQIDPTPIKIVGNYLIFKMNALTQASIGQADAEGIGNEIKQWMDRCSYKFSDEEIDYVALPSGGVHAEAVLGQSNCAEKLDLTRFWNWQDSQIPILPPGIAPLGLNSFTQSTHLPSSQFSQRQLHLSESSSLPTPTGLAVTLQALSNRGMFRDMSAREGTTGLAHTSLAVAGDNERHAAIQASENQAILSNAPLELIQAVSASEKASSVSQSHVGARLNFAKKMDANNDSDKSYANKNSPAKQAYTEAVFNRQMLGTEGALAQQAADVGLFAQKSNKFVSLDEQPQIINPSNYNIGDIVMRYESGKTKAEAASKIITNGKNDPGGKSYGIYQLSSAKGTLEKFLSYFQKHAARLITKYQADVFSNLEIGTQQFDEKWQELASEAGFWQLQHEFIKVTHYNPVAEHAISRHIPSTTAINEALWSISVQHGKAKYIVDQACKKINDISKATEHQIIDAIYSARAEYITSLDSLNPIVKKNIIKRYTSEIEQIKSLITTMPNYSSIAAPQILNK